MLLVLLLTAVAATTLYAITSTEMDDFEDTTTEGWGHGAPTGLVTNADGGPGGAGDSFLRVESTGAAGGPGSRLAVINEDQWTGDYNAIGDTFTISVDLINLGAVDLQIRLGLEGGLVEGEGDRWVTTTAFSLPAAPTEGGGTWQSTSFTLSAADMTQVSGSNPLASTLDAVNQLRFISASATTFQGDPIAAVLGIDNINVLSVPVELQSFRVD